MVQDDSQQMSRKEMLDTGRRSAISTSELGLYSDRSDRYNRNRYGAIVRKFVIGVMVVVTVILVAIFLYDFTFATSAGGKLSQETKHIYVLQNALKKPSNVSKKLTNATLSPYTVVNRTDLTVMQDRSDDENRENVRREDSAELPAAETRSYDDPEFRAQNLNNFKLRKRVLKSIDSSKEDGPEGKQLFNNHALVYRVRQRYKHPESEEEVSSEESRPTPFHWEFKTPHPSSFKRLKYPQLSQYRYPQSSRNIQDIIKYLTNDAEIPNRGIKFTGVYVNPKKYDLYPEIGEMMSNSDRSEEDDNSPYPVALNADPFYQYKPKHPSDVNLLATSHVRFSPTGIHRYNPYYDPYYLRPGVVYGKPTAAETQLENGYPTAHGKKRKAKPFSVMLDIYPITDIGEPSKKTARPRPQVSLDDYDMRRPLQFNRSPKFYGQTYQPLPSVSGQTGLSDEEERQQMIFHLNLYPRRKNKLSRYDIIHRSEAMQPEERQQFAQKIMTPLESIAKHLTDHSAIEESKFEEERRLEENERSDVTSMPNSRYQESVLETTDDESDASLGNRDAINYPENLKDDATVPPNHKPNADDDYASTEKYELDAQRMIHTTTADECENCSNVTTLMNDRPREKNETSSGDIDTIEGFQKFNDSLLAVD